MENERPQTQPAFAPLLLLWSRRRLIVAITVLGMIAGVIASFMITPLYKSTVIMFPGLVNSVNRSLFSIYAGGREDILGIGEKEKSEHLIQMINSAPVRDTIIKRFDLWTTYQIKPDAAHARDEMIRAYTDHVRVSNTRFGSVQVNVLHPEREKAAEIANAISDEVDIAWANMEKQRAIPALAVIDKEYRNTEALVQALQDSLRVLQRAGVNDYRSQSERFHVELARAIASGNERGAKALEERIARTAELGSKYITFDNRLAREVEQLVDLRDLRQRVESDINNEMPRKMVVERAQEADKKHTPVRWLVTLIGTFGAFLCAVLLVVVQDGLQRLRALA